MRVRPLMMMMTLVTATALSACGEDSEANPEASADAAVAQRVDAMMDQTKDMMTGRMAHKYRERFAFGSLDDKAVAEVEAAWFATTLPRHLAFFEKALAEPAPGGGAA